MYPNPYKIFGDRLGLEENYRKQIQNMNYNGFNNDVKKKEGNLFRFCSYNVKYFNFKNTADELIHNFIKEYKIDAFSLIEYHVSEDYYIKHIGESVLFEQTENYGISTHFNLKNIKMNPDMKADIHHIKKINDMDSYILNEERGFTHLYISLYNTTVNIITIHLDVSDEEGRTRLQEITEIYTYLKRLNLTNVLIIGDFNEWNIRHNEPLYEPSLMEYQERTGLEHFSTKVHDFLLNRKFINVFDMFDKNPKFSCWSGKLVDFCYKYTPTWNTLIKIKNIDFVYLDYSDHLPIILDIEM